MQHGVRFSLMPFMSSLTWERAGRALLRGQPQCHLPSKQDALSGYHTEPGAEKGGPGRACCDPQNPTTWSTLEGAGFPRTFFLLIQWTHFESMN